MPTGRHEGSTASHRRPQSELMPRIDPALREVVVAAGRGINPLGTKGRVGLGPPYNPYFSVVIGLLMVGVGAFVSWQLRGVPLVAILLTVPFVALGVLLVAWSSRRIPAWHRARRDVDQYLTEHPGQFPRDLRWFS